MREVRVFGMISMLLMGDWLPVRIRRARSLLRKLWSRLLRSFRHESWFRASNFVRSSLNPIAELIEFIDRYLNWRWHYIHYVYSKVGIFPTCHT